MNQSNQKKSPASAPPYASLGKARLAEMRAQYLADLAKPNIQPVLRVAIDHELQQIDAAMAHLKRVEISERPVLVGEISPAAMQQMIKAMGAAKPPTPIRRPTYPPGIHTLGGFILMRAQQLRAAIRRIRVDHAPHTTAFLSAFDAFIAAQDEMVKREREAEGAASTTSQAPSAGATVEG